MAEGWSYANLSRKAKENGGPEKYIETVKKHSFQEGANLRTDEQFSIALVGLAGGILLCQIPKVIRYFKNKSKEVTSEEAKEAEEKLIDEIKNAEQEEIEGVVPNREEGSLE